MILISFYCATGLKEKSYISASQNLGPTKSTDSLAYSQLTPAATSPTKSNEKLWFFFLVISVSHMQQML